MAWWHVVLIIAIIAAAGTGIYFMFFANTTASLPLNTLMPYSAEMTTAPAFTSHHHHTTAPPILTPAPPSIPEPGSVITIPGNNGSVSCSRYCNGDWGKGQLSARFPQYSGAYSRQQQASVDGTCPCTLSNRVTWNQNTNSGLSLADLGIT